MRFATDVAIVGGCGRVGLPLGLAFADAGLTVMLYDHHQRRRPGRAGKMPFSRSGADEVLERLVGPGPPRGDTDPAVGERGRARRHRRRHTGRRAPQPRPEVRAPGDRGHARPPPRRPAPRAAQHRVPRRHRHGRAAAPAAPTATIDVSFCPERIAEGKAIEELRALPQIVSGRTDRGAERAERALRPAHRLDRPPRGGGGRARQALHEHVALHQVRGGQPAVHDRQRLRPRLRDASARRSRRTTRGPPTCPAPVSPPGRACSRTRCSSRRSTTTTSRSATRA